MTSEQIRRWHRILFVFWLIPGLAISIILAVFTGVLPVLIWNLAISVYTILMTHFLGMRQEAA